MGAKVCNVMAYYHGNDGERGLEFSIHLPFDDALIVTLKQFVDTDDIEGFARWLKAEYPLIFSAVQTKTSPCLVGTFYTLKESGLLSIQPVRKPKAEYGPTFPDKWVQAAVELRDRLAAEDRKP